MSTFIVSDNHINAMLSWANMNCMDLVCLNDKTVLDFSIPEDLQKMAEVLSETNYHSVNTYYNDHDVLEGNITFVFSYKMLSPVEIIKACQCYDYQCSDLSDYEDSDADRISKTIMNRAIAKLPGYADAKWEIR